MPDQHQLILDGESLTLEPLIKAALSKGEDFNIAVTKEKKTVDKILKSRKYVEDKLKNGTKHIYGVNTGFGANKHKYIYGATPEEKADNMKRLTYNLLISHCTGMGDKYPREVVRAAIILRINALAKGHSGVRMELLNLLAGLLNNDITPVVPSQGSVGASGDLAPLSHMAVVLALNPDKPEDIVFGDVEIPDNDTYRVCSAQDVRGLINPVVLEAKEGLALNNGTCFITALASFALSKTINAAKAAHISSVLSLEALLGTKDSLNPGIHNLRRQDLHESPHQVAPVPWHRASVEVHLDQHRQHERVARQRHQAPLAVDRVTPRLGLSPTGLARDIRVRYRHLVRRPELPQRRSRPFPG